MTAQDRYTRRNLIAGAADLIFFSIGLAFYDPLMVIPAFVKELTDSGLMVGIFTAIRVLTITLPGLWAAGIFRARQRKLPLVIYSCIAGRLPILGLVIATYFWGAARPWLVVAILATSVTLLCLSEGLNSISWPDLIGKIIPERMRGRFLGFSQALASMLVLGVGYLVRLILGATGLPEATRWAIVFSGAFLALAASIVSLFFFHEEPSETVGEALPMGDVLKSMGHHLRADPVLLRVVLIQFLMYAANAAFPFIVVRAREVLGAGEEIIGLYLVVQAVGALLASPLSGWLVDAFGSWVMLRLLTATQVLALLAISTATLLGAPAASYIVGIFLVGFVGASSWWAFIAYLLELATPEERPTYLATAGLTTSPTFIAPILFGALYERIMPEWVFAGTVALSLAAFALALTLAKKKGQQLEAGV